MTTNPKVPAHIVDLANAIAQQAEAIRDGLTTADASVAASLLRHNAETLLAWTTAHDAEVAMSGYLGKAGAC